MDYYCQLKVLFFLLIVPLSHPALFFADDPQDSGADEGTPDVQYFVSSSIATSGSGTSQSSPFKTISEAVDAIDSHLTINPDDNCKVWIAAGAYPEEKLELGNDGLGRSIFNVVFEGCTSDFETIDPNDYEFTIGDDLDENRMPLLKGNSTSGPAIRLDQRNSDVVLRNLQIENYRGSGILAQKGSGTGRPHEITFENVIVDSIVGLSESSGPGIKCVGDNCKLRHCIVGNSWGENLNIYGDNNVAEHCMSFCNDDRTDNGTDYYFIVNGNCNYVANCELRRIGSPPHFGHGFTVQDGENNKFLNCRTIGVYEGVYLAKWRGAEDRDVANNEFRDCTFEGGSVHLSVRANNNHFYDCRVDGENSRSGVVFWSNKSWSGLPAHSNGFHSCTFDNTPHVIDFHYAHDPAWDGPATDNFFDENCEFRNANVLVRTQRPNTGTQFSNSKFEKILHFHADDGDPFTNPSFTDCEFVDCGFEPPSTSGNTAIDSDPLFPGIGNIDLGLVGHWKFDEVDGVRAADSTGNNEGELKGSPSWESSGKIGGCIRLHGGDYVDMGNELNLSYADSISIAAWIKADVLNANMGIVRKQGNYRLSTGGGRSGHLISAQPGTVNADSISPYWTPLVTDRWYHIAVVFDSTNPTNKKAQVYIDGILRRTEAVVEDRTDTNQPLQIGKYWSTFKGLIDDVRIYDRPLDFLDISELQTVN